MEVVLPKLFNYQKKLVGLIDEDKRIIVFRKGRQVGASFINKSLCIKWLLQMGEKIAYVTPTNKLAREFFGNLTKNLPKQFIDLANKTELRIESTCGSSLQFFSAESEDSIRGFTFTRIIIDEAAFVKDDVFNLIIYPTFMVKGKTLILSSTPNGESGFFYDHFNRVKVYNDPIIGLIEANIYDNPLITEDDINQIKLNVPERVWKQEYLGEFLGAGAGLFPYIDCLIPEIENKALNQSYAGLDLGKTDRTILTILDEKGNMSGLFEWSKLPYTMIVDNVIKKLTEFNCKNITVESNSIGDAVIDMMKVKLPKHIKLDEFFTSNQSKNKLIEDLILAFEQSTIKIYDKEILKHQLDGMSVDYNHKTRNISYINKRTSDGHSDYVMSLGFALYCLTNANKRGNYQYRFV